MARPNSPRATAEKSATEAAFARYAGALRGYLIRRLRSRAEVGDLAQEIFARFLRKKDKPEVAHNPVGFLFGIAANVVREQIEAQRSGLVEFDSELADEAARATEPALPNPLGEQMGLQRDLTKALSSLPANHLAAVMLIKGEGLSLAEAAERTGLTEGTLAVYLCEARWKLKKLLRDYARKEDET